MGVMRPELVMKSIVPVVMAGVLGIYGLIIAVIISTGSEGPPACLQASRLTRLPHLTPLTMKFTPQPVLVHAVKVMYDTFLCCLPVQRHGHW
jgi:hypothetical protein